MSIQQYKPEILEKIQELSSQKTRIFCEEEHDCCCDCSGCYYAEEDLPENILIDQQIRELLVDYNNFTDEWLHYLTSPTVIHRKDKNYI